MNSTAQRAASTGGAGTATSPWRAVAGAAALLGGGLYAVGFVIGIATDSWNVLGALVVVPILTVLTIPLARRLARTERQPDLASIVMVAFAVKLIGALARYYVAFVAYSGSADATAYDRYGRMLAPAFRRGDFSADLGKFPGTGFIRVLTGAVYAVVGTSRLGGFFVFSWIGFLGLLLFWRAFRIGVPGGDGRRYLFLVLFLPSLVFWPASIGKEAWMILALGICAYGAALVFGRSRSGVGGLIVLVGLVAVGVVRPQLGLIVLAGLVFGAACNVARRRSVLAPVGWIITGSVLIVVGLVVVAQAQSFLGVKNLTQESVNQAITGVVGQTSQGGSEFKPVVVRTPLDVPAATVTVLFRPFPFEAHSVFVAGTSLEGLLLLGLCIASWRRLRAIPRLLRASPYVAYSLAYVFAFIFAFSSFGNFGILARERSQVLPMLLVLLAVPAVTGTSQRQ